MAPKKIGSGRIPELKNLVNYSKPEMLERLKRFGVEPDVNAIKAAGRRATDRIMANLEKGSSPDEGARASITKSVEKAYENSVRLQLKAAIRDYRLAQQDDDDVFMWVTVGNDPSRCGDCAKRHGKRKPMEKWEAVGLPGDDATDCGGNCRCDLIAVGAA